MTGKLTDDSAALTDGSINITLMHTSKGAEIRFEVNDWNGTLDADGSFVTNSRTLDASVPDGTYFAQSLEIRMIMEMHIESIIVELKIQALSKAL